MNKWVALASGAAGALLTSANLCEDLGFLPTVQAIPRMRYAVRESDVYGAYRSQRGPGAAWPGMKPDQIRFAPAATGGGGAAAGSAARVAYGGFGIGVEWEEETIRGFAPSGAEITNYGVAAQGYGVVVTTGLRDRVQGGVAVGHLDGSGEIGGAGDLQGTDLSWKEWSVEPFVQLSEPLSEDTETRLAAIIRAGWKSYWQDWTARKDGEEVISRLSGSNVVVTLGLQAAIKSWTVGVNGSVEGGKCNSVDLLYDTKGQLCAESSMKMVVQRSFQY